MWMSLRLGDGHRRTDTPIGLEDKGLKDVSAVTCSLSSLGYIENAYQYSPHGAHLFHCTVTLVLDK